ncbi:hypothetical protein TNIN_2021 [Trichonephila inaurata madagascariensis]|uniref:Tetratricopeptide repeat protein n=1 Tax=Trichonephila inaurata madagascariensis TaxID=2747483 RepID=A0A8X7BVY9_9ARAC|nr:hypothetical protein TNIN_2021 [Trichonephila inaurata madagascariensis]
MKLAIYSAQTKRDFSDPTPRPPMVHHMLTLVVMIIEPEDVRSYLNVGRVLTNLRRYKEAEDIYRKAKTLFPESGVQEVHVSPATCNSFPQPGVPNLSE